jgi:hypothetical protein
MKNLFKIIVNLLIKYIYMCVCVCVCVFKVKSTPQHLPLDLLKKSIKNSNKSLE